ncbi:hypothetical protein MJO28_006894 [Puccinia striiformis f. sp. tritici]|uniref:Uncharacterized protein n=3 Tax=Puccinia striiformis f. sp. tritici TaxID=168172 RepID=A0A0L0UZE1_9BASI|nr:hypothetical protein MJO28_006894 [Puccinia striiformis f. sp. tritici]KAI7955465.1 hypothetical protein MJO29_006864 [Puccinia striiformis f. sp. tritici]KAI9630377.1 hypothetical protein KEM48_014103 [Puccinia striiformis f. sp. tritici PST-130]KNE92390.1 hypothetical protein PSTG_14226 [Puccinia striiformis f. sp. tritici PST-78]
MAQSTVTPSNIKLFLRKLDLVDQAFENLETKYNGSSNWPCFASLEPLDQATWNVGVKELKSTLLPSFRDQVVNLSKILELPTLSHDEIPKLNRISELQYELDQTLSQIKSFDALVSRRTLFSPAKYDAGHFKDSDGFRVQWLKWKVGSLTSTVCSLFKDCSDLVKAAKLPLSSRFRHPSDYYHTQAISDSKAITLQSINGMINWLTRDALYDLQLNWEHNISIMDDFLGQATRLLAAATCPAKNLTTVYGNAPPPVELAQSITTITKLSILFFRKLLRSAIKQITAQSFTTIDSNPMRALTRAAEDLCWNVEGLVDVLGYARVWTSGILEIIEGTEGRFEGVIRLITSNIFPLIPGGDNPCSVNYLNAWLADWRKLFYAETERCVDIAKEYDHE